MKKNTMICALFLSVSVTAQNASIVLSSDSVCAGQSISAEVVVDDMQLTTPTGTNNQNGYMFDVVATYNATITGFLIDPVSSGGTFYIYYRTGTHVGHENSASGWNLLDSVTNVPAGAGINPGFNINQSIIAGQTLAFYITSTGTNYVYYDNGSSVGTTLASDSYITIKEGVGKAYPFGTTYSPRNFVGSVLYKPEITSYSWNTGGSSAQISDTPQRSMFYSCAVDYSGGGSATAVGALIRKELMVDATANPPNIQAGQTSTLTASVAVERGLVTDPNGANSMNGAMFDLVASNSLAVNGFTVSATTTDTADFEVFYKTGTHVGHEGNSSSWTSIGTYTGIPGKHGIFLGLNNPINMVGGQTVALYITRTDAGGRVHYGNGTGVGNVVNSANGLQILEGKGIAYPFGTTYTPRVLNTIVHFTVDPVTNATYNWSSGGSSASVQVSPNATTNYTVDVGLGGCNEVGNVTVTVGNVGLDENAIAQFNIYPNPTSHVIHIDLTNNREATDVTLIDITGKVLWKGQIEARESTFSLPVNHLANGLYLLKLNHNNTPVVYRVEKL